MTPDHEGYVNAVLVAHTDPNEFNVLLADTLVSIQMDEFITDIKFMMQNVPEKSDIQYAALIISRRM